MTEQELIDESYRLLNINKYLNPLDWLENKLLTQNLNSLDKIVSQLKKRAGIREGMRLVK